MKQTGLNYHQTQVMVTKRNQRCQLCQDYFVAAVQNVIAALCTAHAGGVSVPNAIGRSSMTSSQRASCFGHCKGQIMREMLLPAIWQTVSPGCAWHPHHGHSLRAEPAGFAQCCWSAFCCSLSWHTQSVCVCPRPALTSHAKRQPSCCRSFAPGSPCLVATSAAATATWQSIRVLY